MIEGYDRYQADVAEGRVVCCREVKQAIARQAKDLERSKDPDYPYYFDREEADFVLRFLSMMRCTGGEWKGKRLELADFQAWRNAVIFGWRRKSDGYRRFRFVYIEVARKQGKSEEASALGAYGLVGDGEQGGQVFSAATTEKQARIIFRGTRIMLRELAKESPAIKKRLEILKDTLTDLSTDSYMQALSSDANTLDGKSPSLALVDEYHAHDTDEVVEVLETGQGARQQPLMYIITTAGFNKNGPCYALRTTATHILSGILEDETFFSIIYGLDEEDDWKDPKCWIKANPNIGVTPKWDYMHSQLRKALTRGKTAEIGFKTKNLNMWVGSRTGWIRDELWMACPGKIDMEALKGRRCYGGMDLASTKDFTALALFFPAENENEPNYMLWYFWLPDETFEDRFGKMPSMQQWVEDGYIELTPGNVTDYDYVLKKVKEVRDLYDLVMVGIDPHNALQLILDMQKEGLPVQKFAQGISYMSGPTKHFERLMLQQKINHGNNPVARWMLSNVHIYEDANENIKVHKGKSVEKVDGIVAAIIAVGEWITNPAPKKSYTASEDLAFLD